MHIHGQQLTLTLEENQLKLLHTRQQGFAEKRVLLLNPVA